MYLLSCLTSYFNVKNKKTNIENLSFLGKTIHFILLFIFSEICQYFAFKTWEGLEDIELNNGYPFEKSCCLRYIYYSNLSFILKFKYNTNLLCKYLHK